MANTLTGLIPTLYQSIDTVSRELTGLIANVNLNASGEMAAKDETIRIPIAPTESLVAVTPSNVSPDSGDTTISYVDMSISKSYMVPVRFSGEDEVGLRNGGTFEQIMQNRFTQAMRTIANQVETDLAGLHIYASRAYGTAGTTPFASNIGESAQVRKILEDNGAPTTDMRLVVNTAAAANLRTLSQLSSVNTSGTDAGLRRGILADLNGLGIGISGQILTSTAGTGASATTDNAGYAIGDTVITLASAGTGTIVAGDVITFTGDTNKYVVLSGDTDVSNGGTITLAAPGLRKAIAASATAITVVAAAARNLAFDRNAIQLITRAPAMPSVGDSADDVMNITDPVSGLTFQVAMYRQFRQTQYQVGLAWGYKVIKPEHLAILLG